MSAAREMEEWFTVIYRMLPPSDSPDGFSVNDILAGMIAINEPFDGEAVANLTPEKRLRALHVIGYVMTELTKVRLLRKGNRIDYTPNLRLPQSWTTAHRTWSGDAVARLPRTLRIAVMFVPSMAVPFLLKWWWVIATLAALAVVLRARESLGWIADQVASLF